MLHGLCNSVVWIVQQCCFFSGGRGQAAGVSHKKAQSAKQWGGRAGGAGIQPEKVRMPQGGRAVSFGLVLRTPVMTRKEWRERSGELFLAAVDGFVGCLDIIQFQHCRFIACRAQPVSQLRHAIEFEEFELGYPLFNFDPL